jgi:hypothetical protein
MPGLPPLDASRGALSQGMDHFRQKEEPSFATIDDAQRCSRVPLDGGHPCCRSGRRETGISMFSRDRCNTPSPMSSCYFRRIDPERTWDLEEPSLPEAMA